MTTVNSGVADHLVLNTRKPPFDNAKLREAVTRAVDRRALIAAVYQGEEPWAPPWPPGLTACGACSKASCAGSPATEHRPTRRRPRASSFTRPASARGTPLKLEMLTRNLPAFTDLSAFVVGELKQVGIDASLGRWTIPQWFSLQARGEFQLVTDRTGLEPDDPDGELSTSTTRAGPRSTTRATVTRPSPDLLTSSPRSSMQKSDSRSSVRSR